MDLFLTILKLSGIIVSGALGILGTVTETRSKKTGRLTPWGKWALSLTIAGFGTALLAQIAEQVKGQRDNQIAQDRTNRQLEEADKSLKYLERLATRFDTLSFSVTYELDETNSFFEPLMNFIGRIIPMDNRFTQSATNTSLNSSITNQAMSQTFAENGSNTESGTFSENVAGYHMNSDQTFVTFSVGLNGAGGFEFFLPTRRELLTLLNSDSTPSPEFDKLFDFLNGPHFSIALYTPQNTIPRTPDLYVLATNLVEPPKLVYYANPEKLTITWVFSCPKSNWKQPKRILALPDLVNGSLCHSLLNEPTQISGHLLAVDGELIVDLTKIRLRDFTKLSKPDSAVNLNDDVNNYYNYNYTFVKDSFVNSTSQDLSEDGDYSIVWVHLYKSRFPDEEQMDKILGNQLSSEK